jgi:hypothetical protein
MPLVIDVLSAAATAILKWDFLSDFIGLKPHLLCCGAGVPPPVSAEEGHKLPSFVVNYSPSLEK